MMVKDDRTSNPILEKEFLNNILNNIGDPVFVKDKKSKLIFVNSAFCELFRVNRDDALGKTLAAEVTPEERKSFIKIDKQVLDDGKEIINEETITVRNGTTKIVSTRKTRLIDENGNKYIVGIIRDITELKQAEKELAQEKIFVEALLDSIPGYLYVYDDKGNLIRWNKRHETMTGYSAEELAQMNMSNWFEGDDAIRVIAAVEEVMTKGYGEVEANLLIKGGGKILVHSNGIRLTINGKKYFIGVGIDITERKKIEKALKESEEKYRVLVENQTDLVVKIDVNNKFTYVSKSYCNVFNKKEEELIGKTFIPLIHEDDKVATIKAMEALTKPPYKCYIEQRAMTKDGYRWLAWNDSAILDENNKIKEIIGVGRDITKQKQAEIALKEREEHFRSIVEQSPLSTQMLTPDGTTVQINRAYETMWEITLEDLKGYNILEDKQLIALGIMPYIQRGFSGEATSIPAKEYNPAKILGIGKKLWVKARIYPVKDSSGKIDKVILIHEDITELKQAETKLKESNERYKTLFNNSPVPLWEEDFTELISCLTELKKKNTSNLRSFLISNPDQIIKCVGLVKVLDVNQATLKLHNAKNKKQLIENFEKIFTKKSMDVIAEWLIAIVDGSDSFESESEVQTLSGEIKYINLEVKLDTSQPNKYRALLATTDITERKKIEIELSNHRQHLERMVKERTTQLELANKELESFSYSVSHDLRAPLRHINGFVDLLSNNYLNSLPDKGQYYVNVISDSSRQMGLLIDDLLQFSRTNHHELKKTIIDMNIVFEEAFKSTAITTEGRSIDWIIKDLPKVYCDNSLVKQVWINLLSNAIKFTQKKERAIIKVGYANNEKDFVFYIQDNGVGFDMKYAGRLFGVFQRLHARNEYEGTGIGLANVHRIILRHGGRVWAEAENDKGASFYFTLPKTNEVKNE